MIDIPLIESGQLTSSVNELFGFNMRRLLVFDGLTNCVNAFLAYTD